MARTKASKGTAFVIHWQVPRKPRLIKWDLILIGAIVLSLAFLAARVYTVPVARIVNSLGQDHSVSVLIPPAHPIAPATVPGLISALYDPAAPGTRVNAAQSLASMHAAGATDALVAATYDSDARVREEAAAALGEIGTLQALPRLQELQVVSGNAYIQIAAFEAQGKIVKNIAAAFNVPSSGVQAWAVAQDGSAYAAVYNELFTLRGENWTHVSQLPDMPNTLSAGWDGQALFMATNSSGLYRSQDSGVTWEPMQFGLQTPTQLTVTAVVVSPGNPAQVYIALSAAGSISDQPNSLGIASSIDGGKTWVMLPDSPTWAVTSQLVLDRTAPEYLYGLSDVGPWRYELVPQAEGSEAASAPVETVNP
jgi:hypothetical protein